MGFYEAVVDSTEMNVKNIEPLPKRQGFRTVEQIDLATGWQQMVTGEWLGIGILDVIEEGWHVWGRQIIIAEPGANCGKLQAHYLGMMIFIPAEFRDIIERWPDSERLVMAKRVFTGDIQGVA
ncbi:MAG: hypothetical protein AB9917_18920 [Negativicutes bacterium]